jgi:soluble lytic murein transglycosylase-like protein
MVPLILAALGAVAFSGVATMDPCARVLGPGSDSYDAEIRHAVIDVERIWPVPASFVKAAIHRESGFQPRALSPAGAVGLMQVMPFNARRLGVSPSDLWTPATNILAGTRLLAVLLRHYRGDVISTLVAYNSGPRSPLSPVPENGETPEYVRGVIASWRVVLRCERSPSTGQARAEPSPKTKPPS